MVNTTFRIVLRLELHNLALIWYTCLAYVPSQWKFGGMCSMNDFNMHVDDLILLTMKYFGRIVYLKGPCTFVWTRPASGRFSHPRTVRMHI